MTSNCPNKSNCGRHNSGFTLVELLVVIATIALLVAILLPVLRMAKAAGKKMVCQSNLKQLAYAWNMYLDHYNGRFYQGQNANYNYGGWEGTLEELRSPRPLNRFLDLKEIIEDEKSAKAFCCPADTGGVFESPREKAFHLLGTSYWTNVFLVGQNQFHPYTAQTRELDTAINKRIECLNLSQITARSSQLLLIGDQGWYNQWAPMAPPDEANWERLCRPYAEWHIKPQCYNLAFMDCHAAFVKIRRAYYVTDDYSVLPFKDLYGMAYQVQQTLP